MKIQLTENKLKTVVEEAAKQVIYQILKEDTGYSMETFVKVRDLFGLQQGRMLPWAEKLPESISVRVFYSVDDEEFGSNGSSYFEGAKLTDRNVINILGSGTDELNMIKSLLNKYGERGGFDPEIEEREGISNRYAEKTSSKGIREPFEHPDERDIVGPDAEDFPMDYIRDRKN